MPRPSLKAALRAPRTQDAIGRLAGRYLDATMRSTRWQTEIEPLVATIAAGQPCIVTFWHECLPTVPALKTLTEAALHRRGKNLPGVHVLVSRHRDGQLIGRAVARFGVGLVAGSTSRGGAAGLRSLARVLREGDLICITPDGPRGPRRKAAIGVAQLAALTGAPVICVGAASARAITLKSWDSMRLPLPFARGAMVVSEPFTITRDTAETALPMLEAAMTAMLDRATALCRQAR